MHLKLEERHFSHHKKPISSPETIHRSPSEFIGGQFQLNKSAEHTSRITGIDYPDMRDVTYTYGAQGAPHNSAGRLVSRRDESGSISYRYGLMGEVTYEERSLERLTPLEPERSAAMRYRSDYLGRMASITYPYDPGGQVTGINADRSEGSIEPNAPDGRPPRRSPPGLPAHRLPGPPLRGGCIPGGISILPIPPASVPETEIRQERGGEF